MKNVLCMIGAGIFGLVLAFFFMKATSVPKITFSTMANGEEFIWEAKHSDGTEMSVIEAQKLIDEGGRYESTYYTPAIFKDSFIMDLEPKFFPSF